MLITLSLSKMKNIMPLTFQSLPIIVRVVDSFSFIHYISIFTAAAPKISIEHGESICNFV